MLFQALGEARGTGGVAGLFGVLRAADGRISLGRIAPHETLSFSRVSSSSVPPWYQRTYALQGALRDWRQANLSPNFPVDAGVMLEMYRQSFGRELDGVVALDAVALSAMMRGTGPFSVPGFDKTITTDNVVRILSRDAYLDFPNRDEQNVFLAALVRAFWQRLESGSVDFEALGEGLSEAVSTRHLMVFSADDADQAHLEALDVDGSLTQYGPNLQNVFHNNYAINKVDFYLRRQIDTLIELGSGGDLSVTTEVTLRNDAPPGPESDLLGGVDNNVPPGTNRMTLNFLLPLRARAGQMRVDGERDASIGYTDSGHPLIWDVVTIPPGETTVVELMYVVPHGASLGPDGGELSFSFVPQPALNADKLEVRVRAPGYTVSSGDRVGVNEHVTKQDLVTPETFTYRIELI